MLKALMITLEVTILPPQPLVPPPLGVGAISPLYINFLVGYADSSCRAVQPYTG